MALKTVPKWLFVCIGRRAEPNRGSTCARVEWSSASSKRRERGALRRAFFFLRLGLIDVHTVVLLHIVWFRSSLLSIKCQGHLHF